MQCFAFLVCGSIASVAVFHESSRGYRCRSFFRLPHARYAYTARTGRALDEDALAADLVRQYEARMAALEQPDGRQALELELLEGL